MSVGTELRSVEDDRGSQECAEETYQCFADSDSALHQISLLLLTVTFVGSLASQLCSVTADVGRRIFTSASF